jgi:pyruvate dehydrogenase E2 component (dihydrolipoamide acetyltransferase)
MGPAGGEDKVFLDLQRRVVSHMISSSLRTVPHVSFVYEPDVTEFIKVFKLMNGNTVKYKHKLTLNTSVLKIIAEGLEQAPTLNALVDYTHDKDEGNVFIKEGNKNDHTLADGRMITPTILDCGNKSLS